MVVRIVGCEPLPFLGDESQPNETLSVSSYGATLVRGLYHHPAAAPAAGVLLAFLLLYSPRAGMAPAPAVGAPSSSSLLSYSDDEPPPPRSSSASNGNRRGVSAGVEMSSCGRGTPLPSPGQYHHVCGSGSA